MFETRFKMESCLCLFDTRANRKTPQTESVHGLWVGVHSGQDLYAALGWRHQHKPCAN